VSLDFQMLDSDAHVRKEKAAARELRASRWWQNRIQNAVCHYCQKSLRPAEATMDHIVPISQGGRSVAGNIAVACKPCNTAKRDRTAVEWQLEASAQSSSENGGETPI